ncbi:MAG: hypothetical protein AAGA48_20900 [Myxococcota bacterium]
MLFTLSAVAMAHLHPQPTDPFIVWDQRWLVQTEVQFPMPRVLHATWHEGARANAIRMRAVVDCDRDEKRGARRWKVTCTIQDLALQAQATAPLNAVQRATIEEWDALLTGMPIALVVRDDGSILDTALPRLRRGTPAERERHEFMRQLTRRLVAPLQLDLPERVSEGVTWSEPSPEQFEIPTFEASSAMSQVVHRLDERPDYWHVQSRGEGLQLPRPLTMAMPTARDVFRMQYESRARFDADTKMMVERVWKVGGRASPLGRTPGRYSTFGQLLWLSEDDAPSLGASGFVSGEEWSRSAYAPGVSTL